MGKNSSIEWTDHTFNPWWGCVKVSPACLHCYAETWAKRLGQNVWGANAPRRFFGNAHWREPFVWNEEAGTERRRRRVFCASMADVFEWRADLNSERAKLWKLIAETPWLDWLLLTKRPENIGKLVPWGSQWPSNVWLGCTVENQAAAKQRIPLLVKYPAAIRFLSCEPLLGPVDLGAWIKAGERLDWVIAGGESGPSARPMHPGWALELRNQCRNYGIAFHFKQWGHWAPVKRAVPGVPSELVRIGTEPPVRMARLGKKLAGRVLDGVTWNGVPDSAHVIHAES